MRPSLLTTTLYYSVRRQRLAVHRTRCGHLRTVDCALSPSLLHLLQHFFPYGRCQYFSSSQNINQDTFTSSWQDRLPHPLMSLNVWSEKDIPPLLLCSKSASTTTKETKSTTTSSSSLHDTTNTTSIDIMAVDKSTRFLLKLLQNMALGLLPPLSVDRGTTQRCNRALELLTTLSSSSSSTITTGLALRADTILQLMELASLSSSSSSDATTTTSNTTSVINSTIREHVVLPYPTATTYWMVLKLIAKDTSVPPSRAMQIVQRMEERYYHRNSTTNHNTTTGSSRNSDGGPGDSMELQPTILHYNQVLSSYAISTTLETKAHDAAHLLLNILPTKGAIQPDISSYGHVLRACALSYMTPKSMKLGSEIAPMIYQRIMNRSGDEKDHHRHSLQPTPHIFAFYIKALSYMTGSTTTTTTNKDAHVIQQQQRADALIEEAFRDCQRAGMVNKHVLHAFRTAASIPLQDAVLGPNSSDKNLMLLLNTMPKKFTQNAKQQQ